MEKWTLFKDLKFANKKFKLNLSLLNKLKHSVKYLIKTADLANRSFQQTKSCLSLREDNLNCVSKKWVRNIWSAEKYNIHFVCFMFSFNLEFFFQRGTNRSHFLSVFEIKIVNKTVCYSAESMHFTWFYRIDYDRFI